MTTKELPASWDTFPDSKSWVEYIQERRRKFFRSPKNIRKNTYHFLLTLYDAFKSEDAPDAFQIHQKILDPDGIRLQEIPPVKNRRFREEVRDWAQNNVKSANIVLREARLGQERILIFLDPSTTRFVRESRGLSTLLSPEIEVRVPWYQHSEGPRPAPGFRPAIVPRVSKIIQLAKLLCQKNRSIVLTGPAGIGKTAIFFELAKRISMRPSENRVFLYIANPGNTADQNEMEATESLHEFLSTTTGTWIPNSPTFPGGLHGTNLISNAEKSNPDKIRGGIRRLLLRPPKGGPQERPNRRFILIDSSELLADPSQPTSLIRTLLTAKRNQSTYVILGAKRFSLPFNLQPPETMASVSILPKDPDQERAVRSFVAASCERSTDEEVDCIAAYSRANFISATHLVNASIAQSDSQPIDEDFLEDQLVSFFRTRPDRIWPSSFPALSTSESIRRSGSVQEILAAIDQSDSPIHVLEAPPGFGKTELCRQLYWHLWKTSHVPLHYLDWSSTTFEQANHTLQALASNKNGQAWLVADNLERYFKSAEVFALINHALQTTPLPHNFKIIIPTWTDALPLYLLNLEDLPRTSLSNLLTDQDEAITEFLTRFLRPPLLNDLPSILEFVAHNFTIAQATVRIARDMEYWPINTAEKANYDLHERFQAMLQRREYNTQESRASLHLLAIAEGPIPHRTFKGWMSDLERTIPDRTFHNPLTFCHPEPLRQDRLTPFHSLFRDFLKEDAKPYAADLHELIVRYYKNHPQTTQECEYRRRYLTHHLYEIGHLEEVLAELSDDHIQWYRRVYGDDANLQRLLNCGIAAANTLVKPDDSLRLWMHQQAITAGLKAGPI